MYIECQALLLQLHIVQLWNALQPINFHLPFASIKRHLIRSLWSYFNQNFDPFACIIVCGSLFPVPLDSPLNFFVHTMQLLHSNHFTPSLRAHNVHLNFMPINHTYHSYCVYGQVYMLYGLSTYIILSYQIFSTMYSTPTILHPPNGTYITCHN
jgi:hypothetical protein